MAQAGRLPCAAPVTETYTSLSATQTLHEAMIPWRRLETIPECGGSRNG